MFLIRRMGKGEKKEKKKGGLVGKRLLYFLIFIFLKPASSKGACPWPNTSPELEMEQTKSEGRDLFCSKIEKKSGAIFPGAGAARRARPEEGASPPRKINKK